MITVGPPVVIEAQPSVSPPMSTMQEAYAVSIHLTSGQLAKTVAGGKTISLPLGAGQLEAFVQFPAAVDGRATSVTLQQTTGHGSWQVQPRDPPSPDQVAFMLRGTDIADFVVQVQPPLGAGAVRFAVRVTPTTTITADDASGMVQLNKGDRFSLELPEGYTWSVTVADELIASRDQDEQSIFVALQSGSTNLLVSGDPTCHHAGAGCLAPSLSFEIHLVVV
ncbi:MAG: hypothetical protein M3069_32215 [Chloroflexota bacterium]|nr:hypothetical protein [Chloroflexota bacterium]